MTQKEFIGQFLVDENGNHLQELTCTMNEEYQFTEVTLPSGVENGQAVLVYETPTLFTVACLISIVCALLLVAGEIFLLQRRRR